MAECFLAGFERNLWVITLTAMMALPNTLILNGLLSSFLDKCSLRTGSLRGRKKIRRAKCESGSEASGSQSVNPRAKWVGRGGACRHCFWCVLPPLWWLACYKSVKEVIKPVKIDVFFSALMRWLFLITFYRTRDSRKCKSNGSVFAVSAKSCWIRLKGEECRWFQFRTGLKTKNCLRCLVKRV